MYHRRGLGKLLLGRVVERFLSQGITSMVLFGEASNPTNGFYEAMGGERLYAPNGDFHGAYGWRDLQALAARCRAS
jgi:GNAT superfamily N-acetyltransferase